MVLKSALITLILCLSVFSVIYALDQPISPELSTETSTVSEAKQPVALKEEAKIEFNYLFAGADENAYYLIFRMISPEGLKTYWRKPGFGGIAPEFHFSESENLKDFKIFWGMPEKYSSSGLINYVLPKEADILLKLYPERVGQPISLKGHLDYGYCDTQCKAGRENINIDLNMEKELDITVAERQKIIQSEPRDLLQNSIKVSDFRNRIDRKSHIISFMIEGIKELSEEDIFYTLDTDYEIVRPIIQKRDTALYTITMDFVNLYKTPSQIEVILKNGTKQPLLFKGALEFQNNL